MVSKKCENFWRQNPKWSLIEDVFWQIRSRIVTRGKFKIPQRIDWYACTEDFLCEKLKPVSYILFWYCWTILQCQVHRVASSFGRLCSVSCFFGFSYMCCRFVLLWAVFCSFSELQFWLMCILLLWFNESDLIHSTQKKKIKKIMQMGKQD